MFQINPTMNNQQKAYMVVFICPAKDKTYNIEVEPDTTLGELSNELHSALQCQPDERCALYFNNMELQNDQTLNHYQIGKGRQIEIKIVKTQSQAQQQRSNQMHEYTFIVPQKNLRFTPPKIDPNDNAQVAYDLVRKNYNYSIQSWAVSIYFGNALLKPDQSFNMQGIEDNTTFTVNLKSIGGQKRDIK